MAAVGQELGLDAVQIPADFLPRRRICQMLSGQAEGNQLFYRHGNSGLRFPA